MAGMFAGLLYFIAATCPVSNVISDKPQDSLTIGTPGDIVIAGLSPIHYPPGAKDGAKDISPKRGGNCNGNFNFRGLQHAEAILFAVDMINKDPNILPGVSLGVDIRDTCNSVDYAIRETLRLSFVQEAYKHGEDLSGVCWMVRGRTKPNGKTVAVVGAAYSGITMAVSSLAGLFYVPVVSYASTSRLLEDKTRFKYFLRTVPSDTLQAQAMVDIIKKFKWNFVAAIASDTEYGRSGIDAFKSTVSKLSNYSICIAVDGLFTTRSPKNYLQRIIRRLHEQPKARVIVLFAELNDAEYFINTANEENLKDRIWIGSDAFASSYRVLKGNEEILRYWIATSPTAKQYQPFKDYYLNITRERKMRNPWISLYEDVIAKHCNSSRGQIEFSPYTTTAIDAVYAVAHGLNAMLKCTRAGCKVNVTKMDQNRVYDFIKNVSFDSPTGNHISFDANGSAKSNYLITFIENQTSSGRATFRTMGEWNLKQGVRFFDKYNDPLNPFRDVNIASCSAQCKLGYRKTPNNKFPECCWRCSRCQGNSITNSSGLTSCKTCPPGTKANREKSFCDVIEPTLIVMTTAGLAVVGAYALGTLAVLGTLVVFVVKRQSALVRASSKELSYVILCGIAWTLTNAIVVIVPPTTTLCQLRPFFASTGISTVIGSLLSKTNRISRIFSLKTMRTGRTCLASNRWQLTFVSICVLLGNAVAVVWIIISPFEVVAVPHGGDNLVTTECSERSGAGFAAWATYHVGLTILCTYQAFLVRKIPENYNEAKFIAFTMVTLCISGAVYVPTYYGTHGVYRAVLTASLYIFCSYATLACLFGPKLYIIIFRPEKNLPLPPRLESMTGSTRPQFNRSISALTTLTSSSNNPSSSTGVQNHAISCNSLQFECGGSRNVYDGLTFGSSGAQ